MNPQLSEVVSWILAGHPELRTIDPDYDLIDNRLIDSLRFVEFIILIERLTGKPIEVKTLNIDDLRSLNSIERHFFTVVK